MQLTGTQFTNTAALFGNDLSTFPDFLLKFAPAEEHLPVYQVTSCISAVWKFFTPGDSCDVLVVMNAAALKANLRNLRKGE